MIGIIIINIICCSHAMCLPHSVLGNPQVPPSYRGEAETVLASQGLFRQQLVEHTHALSLHLGLASPLQMGLPQNTPEGKHLSSSQPLSRHIVSLRLP